MPRSKLTHFYRSRTLSSSILARELPSFPDHLGSLSFLNPKRLKMAYFRPKVISAWLEARLLDVSHPNLDYSDINKAKKPYVGQVVYLPVIILTYSPGISFSKYFSVIHSSCRQAC